MDEWNMSLENWGNDTGTEKTKHSDKTLCQYHFVYHPAIEPAT